MEVISIEPIEILIDFSAPRVMGVVEGRGVRHVHGDDQGC